MQPPIDTVVRTLLLGAALLAGSCESAPPGPEATQLVPLALGRTTLVCVTARLPPTLPADEVDRIYEDAWKAPGMSREGAVSSLLFEFEGGERVMFALLFTSEPDGLADAALFESEVYPGFADVLNEAGFTEISPQSNLLYVNGSGKGGTNY